MDSAAIDLTGLMLGDALDRAKASFDIFEKPNVKKAKRTAPKKKMAAKKKAKTAKVKSVKKSPKGSKKTRVKKAA